MNERLNNMSEYWKMYDTLCHNIKLENEQLSEQLMDAKLYLNSLTDGWYDFLNLFKELIFKNSCNLSIDYRIQAGLLISQLENTLAAQNKYGGMTVNERLVVANKINDFDDAINSKDIPKITEILRSVELSDGNINEIIKHFKLPFIEK